MSTTDKTSIENTDKSRMLLEAKALELKQLLSPEKALFLLYNLVDRNPRLWHDLHDLLYPLKHLSVDDVDVVDNEQKDHEINDDDGDVDHAQKDKEDFVIKNVLNNLRELQLSQLPLDTLGVITSYLPLTDCLRFSETNSFFNDLVPKYIDIIHINQDITESIYSLFYKCQRLRHLSIDANARKYEQENIVFLCPFSKFKSLQHLILINVRFLDTTHDKYRFDGGTYSLRELQIISCVNINCDIWLQLTSKKHCPDLQTLIIRTDGYNLDDHQKPPVYKMDIFKTRLVSSTQHTQIRNLAISIDDVEIIKAMRMNHDFIHNLRKLEIGLMDRRSPDDDTNDIAILFQQIFMTNKENEDNDDQLYSFGNLEILLIDFCPNSYSRGYNDISPADFDNFGLNLPKIFPSLKLLSLYGSHSPLLFTEEYLYGLLRNKCLPQIIDLSLGFEDLSANILTNPDNDNNLIENILSTFPNLAWLTLENDQFLLEADRFHKMVDEVKLNRNDTSLQWITLCASEKDEIYELSNGLFIEYWDRGIEQCDFDAALKRSQQIVDNQHHKKKNNKNYIHHQLKY